MPPISEAKRGPCGWHTDTARILSQNNPSMTPSRPQGTAFSPRARKKSVRLDVPQSGWSLLRVEHLGEASATCEVCANVGLRHVHNIAHPRYSGPLTVGEDCAGHMCDDLKTPHRAQRRLKDRAARRQRRTEAKRAASTNGRGHAHQRRPDLRLR